MALYFNGVKIVIIRGCKNSPLEFYYIKGHNPIIYIILMNVWNVIFYNCISDNERYISFAYWSKMKYLICYLMKRSRNAFGLQWSWSFWTFLRVILQLMWNLWFCKNAHFVNISCLETLDYSQRQTGHTKGMSSKIYCSG